LFISSLLTRYRHPDNDMQTGHFYSPRALEERQRKYSDAKHMRLINLIL
jgi:hypothetical protein